MAKTTTFSQNYPNLFWYIENLGVIEIGTDEHSDSWVRLIDEGGTRYESEEDDLDEALTAADKWAGEEFDTKD
ncbi:MAG: hypothetical protein ACKVTZ_21485 [Bacteroidia bacterium]